MKPMMAVQGTTTDLEQKGFLYEPKLDGIRALLHFNGNITITGRKEDDITNRYPELQKIKPRKHCILDGEIIIYDTEGNPSFHHLQQRMHLTKHIDITYQAKHNTATFLAFDILEYEGIDVTKQPLTERKQLLKKIITENTLITITPTTTNGKQLWHLITKRNIEGVVAKKENSKYYPGIRSKDWIKIKDTNTTDAIILGYTTEKRALTSLALGIKNKNTYTFIGKVGTGFNEQTLKELTEILEKTSTPATTLPKEVIPVKPQYVAEIKYQNITQDKKLRAPVFLRLRDDKKPEECTKI